MPSLAVPSAVTSKGMYISDVEICWWKPENGGPKGEAVAGAMVVFNSQMRIRRIKIVRRTRGLVAVLPLTEGRNGLTEVVTLLDFESRELLERVVISAYRELAGGPPYRSTLPMPQRSDVATPA